MEYRERYFNLLKKSFPTIEACRSEIINLEAILSLPKGTEHFLSDLHGEYVTKDLDEAKYYYKLSIDYGNDQARKLMTRMMEVNDEINSYD